MHVKVGGSWRTVNSPRVKVGNSWRTVQQGLVKISGTWRTFYTSLAVNYASTVTSTGSAFAACGTTTSAQIAAPTITGGSGTYSYSWAKTSGSAAVNISSTTAQRPAFSAYACDGTPESAVYTVTVTDTVYGGIATDTVSVNCYWTNLS